MKYTTEHEWLKKEDNCVLVGITQYAAEQLGDVVFVELPEVGKKVSKDEEIVVIESVKAASDILAPLKGTIVAVNQSVVDDPSLINTDPTGNGLFFKMRLDKASELDSLMDEDQYKKLINDQ